MNNYVKEFFKRGLMFSGFGPIILGIVYLVLNYTNKDFSLTGIEAFLGILSIYILAFIVEDNKVYGITKNEKYLIKQRIYVLEEMYNNTFIKINQSCLINIDKIKRFDASLSGFLLVTLKNGYSDYV